MIEAPHLFTPLNGMSIYARARVCIICTLACATLGWAHQSNIEHVELDPARHEISDEQARIMLRDALIKEATRSKLHVEPDRPTEEKLRGVSKKAYTIRAHTRPPVTRTTLSGALEELELIKSARRERMKARGEDVSDMNATGIRTFHQILNEPFEDYEPRECGWTPSRSDGNPKKRWSCRTKSFKRSTYYVIGPHDLPPQNAPLETYDIQARNSF